jgi:exosortase/archaeosortase family protein
LEIAAMMGMVLMFPGWTLRKRALLAVIGAVTIFLANCARLFMIIIVLHNMGKDSLFISHTIIGRALFFLIVVFIYWYIITRPMLKDVRNKLHKDLAK